MNKFVSLSICIPVFNEENTLKDVIKDLVRILSPAISKLEIIIVNDGSYDKTAILISSLVVEFEEVKVINHNNNEGIGKCFRDALKVASSKYFTWFPADYENNIDEIKTALSYVADNTIVTSYHIGGDPRSFMRKNLSKIYTILFNTIFNLNLKYYNGLTIFPTESLLSVNLTSNGFGLFAESIVKVLRRGLIVVEFFTEIKKRDFGKSKSISIRSIFQILNDMRWVLIILNNRILRKLQ